VNISLKLCQTVGGLLQHFDDRGVSSLDEGKDATFLVTHHHTHSLSLCCEGEHLQDAVLFDFEFFVRRGWLETNSEEVRVAIRVVSKVANSASHVKQARFIDTWSRVHEFLLGAGDGFRIPDRYLVMAQGNTSEEVTEGGLVNLVWERVCQLFGNVILKYDGLRLNIRGETVIDADGKRPEDEFILGQRASFVTAKVFDFGQILKQIQCVSSEGLD